MWKLYKTPVTGEIIGVFKIKGDGSFTSVSLDNPEYLAWLEEGNEPLPPDPTPEPESLTAQQKLEAAGLTIEELKELLCL